MYLKDQCVSGYFLRCLPKANHFTIEDINKRKAKCNHNKAYPVYRVQKV